MRCLSYCTASIYQLNDLSQYLINNGFLLKHFDDVIFARMKNNEDIDIFFFPFGCVTIWGGDDTVEQLILEELKEFEIEPLDKVWADKTNFEYNILHANNDEGATFINEEKNKIVLGNKSEYTKLSISYALAQSVKLVVLEDSVNTILKTTAPIRKELASTGPYYLTTKTTIKTDWSFI